jgi:hypothetical protein
MKNNHQISAIKILLISVLLFSINLTSSQKTKNPFKSQDDFWSKVQFGGGIGLSFGSGYTDISISPSAIYNFDKYFALGLGAQYTYINQKNSYDSHLYGGSIIGLFNPIREIQLSAELEELRVDINLNNSAVSPKDYWNTALFLGAGYRNGNLTIGIRYNVLNNDRSPYNEAFMPFARVYF